MSEHVQPPALSAMIDRASNVTAAEVDSLGTLWKSNEGISISYLSTEMYSQFAVPQVTNVALLAAWQRALDTAVEAGRADELDSARDAGRAMQRRTHRLKVNAAATNGAEKAARAAVLAVGVRDLISQADYEALIGPWQEVLGSLQ